MTARSIARWRGCGAGREAHDGDGLHAALACAPVVDGDATGSEGWGYHLPSHTEQLLATIRTSDPTVGGVAAARVIDGSLFP